MEFVTDIFIIICSNLESRDILRFLSVNKNTYEKKNEDFFRGVLIEKYGPMKITKYYSPIDYHILWIELSKFGYKDSSQCLYEMYMYSIINSKNELLAFCLSKEIIPESKHSLSIFKVKDVITFNILIGSVAPIVKDKAYIDMIIRLFNSNCSNSLDKLVPLEVYDENATLVSYIFHNNLSADVLKGLSVLYRFSINVYTKIKDNFQLVEYYLSNIKDEFSCNELLLSNDITLSLVRCPKLRILEGSSADRIVYSLLRRSIPDEVIIFFINKSMSRVSNVLLKKILLMKKESVVNYLTSSNKIFFLQK